MHRSQDQRINLGELKGHILKKIGVDRSKRYFYYLSRFLSQKLSKREFDKACFRLLGREDLSLHNQLIRSILRNATKPVGEESGSLAPNHCNQKVRDSPLGSNGKVVGMEKGYLSRYEQARVNVLATPLVAPLGIQFSSANGSRRKFPVSTSADVMSGLPDTEMLRKRMESIAVGQGLEGVSMECAYALNTLLDVYLKKLIKSCIDLVKARSTNGVWGSNSDRRQDHYSISLLDFRTAMELNPHQLGEDWPTLRERISIRAFEEQDSEV